MSALGKLSRGSRGLQIVFHREQYTGQFELLELEAPQTADILWQSLPITVSVNHCISAGREVFALLPPFPVIPPPENEVMLPAAGDLWFVHLPADFAVVPPGTNPSGQGIFDLAIWYGPDSWAPTPRGDYLRGTHVGRIVSSPEELAEACSGIWLRGRDTATITAVRFDGD